MAFAVSAQETKITSATTTPVLGARAGATDEARVKAGMMTIRNIGATNNTITIRRLVTATNYEIVEFVLRGGQEYVNPWDAVFNGTTDSMTIVTSSASALDVVVNFVEKT